ncbi:chromosome segregation protein SMC [Halobacillus naozhouensis]|uniref:Chromosome partition protein Smc n=1 Tax=Halobacillus naozhouensis TaxID=554880 RepID=A0ABY8J2I1_9BACI|nr:chromosome segregation protein SMC [Halobacillus naozhouensis]WFT76709.1 chromosome segregation protein SMC [Halobacillus naozhouensis]
MFLKRLDTVGFKSFAERVTVDFVSGVTSVVGPNGSGKSNITDAIRWVLGEQSARSLRGTKMEDIIFAGSDTRKALNMAEVTLTLNNEQHTLPLDYQEVSVTRRVYRSGESEFYINNQTCRLKDIVDLFMDSGLGREAFSIISQGKVEEILSSKPEERRSIFEEAAGVLKYKQRKKKAEHKLFETQENLNRVEDIIHEIDGQLEPLREQASVAKDYLEKKDELKHVEISLLVTQIENLHEEWQGLLVQLEEVKQEENELKAELDRQAASITKKRENMEALEESIEDLQETLLVLTRELENLEGKKELMKERHKHYSENKTKLTSEYEELSSQLEIVKQKAQSETDKLKTVQQNRKETKVNLKQAGEALHQGVDDIEAEIEDCKSDYIDLLNKQAAKRNEQQTLEQQLVQLSNKKGVQQGKFQEMSDERSAVESSLKDRNDKLQAASQKRQDLDQELETLDEQIKKDDAAYQEWQQKLYQGYQYLEKMRSKKEMLEEMKEDYSGYYHGVREILKAREKQLIHGVEGAVLEVINIPANYLTAIETALGAQAQHVIVQDEKAGRQAIHWLKQNNKGRATFLPLTTIQPRSVFGQAASRLAEQEGFLGTASELIQFDSRYDKAIQHLLGHIVIATNLEQANEIARAVNRKYRIVTLEGDVVNPGGAMSGGAQKKSNQSLFTREKELQELTEKITSFDLKARDVEAKVKRLKDKLSSNAEKREQVKEQSISSRNTEYEEQSAVREMQVKVSHLNDQLQLYDQDQSQFNQDQSQAKERLTTLAEELTSLSKQLEDLQERIDDLTAAKDQQQEDEANQKERYQNLQIKLAEQDSAVENQKEKAGRLQEDLQSVQDQLAKNRHSYQQLVEVVDSNQSEEDIMEDIEKSKIRKETTSALIQERREERNQLAQAVHQEEQTQKETQRRHQNYLQDIQQKEVKANRLDVELENLLNYLQEEYVITFEKAKNDYQGVEDVHAASTRVKLIKRAIDELGTVNLGAIDEYERIVERYDFLTGQQRDLLEAKETLYSIIYEMDSEMERRFEETFTKIRAEFGEVFKDLFGGGKADLQLTQPDDMLETGVDIVAQPPGKKLQNLSLLSGGERALTAIALLFSILRVRPVPFCVLDEVEAALDEANVERFARFLKEFSERTQFIVITHRKGTMEESDVLYGVTMQESGVSKLVSVRLEDTAELVGT